MDVCHRHPVYQLVHSCSWEDSLNLLKIVPPHWSGGIYREPLVTSDVFGKSRDPSGYRLCSWFPEYTWAETEAAWNSFCTLTPLWAELNVNMAFCAGICLPCSLRNDGNRQDSSLLLQTQHSGLTADRAPKYSCAGCSA